MVGTERVKTMCRSKVEESFTQKLFFAKLKNCQNIIFCEIYKMPFRSSPTRHPSRHHIVPLIFLSHLISFYLLTYYLLSLTFSVFYRSQTCHDRLPFRLLPRAHYNFTLVVTEGNLKTYLCGLMWGKCVALSCWREKVGLVAAFSWEVDLWRGALVWTIKYMIYMPSSAVILEFRVGFGVNAEIKAQAWYDCLFLYW